MAFPRVSEFTDAEVYVQVFNSAVRDKQIKCYLKKLQ